MKNKFYVIFDYLMMAFLVFTILTSIVLFINSFIDHDAKTEEQEAIESSSETSKELDNSINESKLIYILDEPTEAIIPTENLILTENQISTETKENIIETNTDPTVTEDAIIIETNIESIESENEDERVYFDVPLESDLQDLIFELCDDRGIDPAIIVAMIYKESIFNSGAVGDGGKSLGLMQIQPRWNGSRMDELGCHDLFDPYQNVTVGIDCFADYFDESGSIEWSLMAYNGGPSYASNLWNSGQISGYASAVLSYADSIRNN